MSVRECRICHCTTDAPCKQVNGDPCWDKPKARDVCGGAACESRFYAEKRAAPRKLFQKYQDKRLNGARAYKNGLAKKKSKRRKVA